MSPSGIIYDEVRDAFVVIASRERAIFELARNGGIVELVELPGADRHRQPEGLEQDAAPQATVTQAAPHSGLVVEGVWSGLATARQLSTESTTPSPSVSAKGAGGLFARMLLIKALTVLLTGPASSVGTWPLSWI